MPDTGEVTGLRDRADLLDEGIDLVRTLWDGGSSYHGRALRLPDRPVDLGSAATPVQPRIPIWVVGVWPAPKSIRRTLRCDGVIPQYGPLGYEPGPREARAVSTWLTDHGAADGFDVIADGETPAGDPRRQLPPRRPGRKPAARGGLRPDGRRAIRCGNGSWLARHAPVRP